MDQVSKTANNDKSTSKAVLVTAFLLAVCLIYLLSGLLFGFYIPCPFRTLTGLKCPGCGLSHAAQDIIRLDFKAAIHDNALSLVIFPYLGFMIYRNYLYLSGKKDTPSEVIGRRIDVIFLVMILFWWIIRNIIGI